MGEIYKLYEDEQEVERFEVRDLRVKTRFAIDNAFYDEFTPIFGPTLSMVYIAFVRHSNKEQKSWPSQKLIANHLKISREWVGYQTQILQIFNLIRKVRVGKMCTNRYYLIDEKQWNRDFDDVLIQLQEAIDEYAEKSPKKLGRKVMLTEFTSLLRTGVHIRAVRSAHKMLLEFTSNRKDKQERINKKGKGIFTVKKTKAENLKPVEEIIVGKGSKKRTFFDTEKSQMVTEYYD